jgi:hypothetical protein
MYSKAALKRAAFFILSTEVINLTFVLKTAR